MDWISDLKADEGCMASFLKKLIGVLYKRLDNIFLHKQVFVTFTEN